MIPTDELEDYPKRTSSFRRVVIAALVVGAIGLIAYGVLRPAERDSNAGTRAPEFELELLDGSGTLSSEDLRGRPVVLNLWASWCVPCLEEMPLFQREAQAYEEIAFVGVLIKDTPDSARKFLRDNGITYPILWDPDQELARELGVDFLPETFFIDSSWRFIEGVTKELAGSGGTRSFGAINEDELQERIDRLLEGSS